MHCNRKSFIPVLNVSIKEVHSVLAIQELWNGVEAPLIRLEHVVLTVVAGVDTSAPVELSRAV
jgi:hypothetical protein